MLLRALKSLCLVVTVAAFLGVVLAQDQPGSSFPKKQTSCPNPQISKHAGSASSEAGQKSEIKPQQQSADTKPQQQVQAKPERDADSQKAAPASGSVPSSLISKVPAGLQPACGPENVLPTLASDSEQSIAAVVARSKSTKNEHSKKVITDDDLETVTGPLPRLRMAPGEDGEEVVAAIAEYKKTHTPEETEDVVHRWFDDYDHELAQAINANAEIRTTRAANVRNGYNACQTTAYRDYEEYQRCQLRGLAEIRGTRDDQFEVMHNAEWISRVQQALTNIHSRMFIMGLNYSWFKVRTGF
jgi:hypothetical protein